MANETRKEIFSKLTPRVEKCKLGGELLWERWRFRIKGTNDRRGWVNGRKEIQGEKGIIAVGHFTGEALENELANSIGLHRFVWTVIGEELLFLPAGVEFSGEVSPEGAWVIELSSTGDRKVVNRPISIRLEEIKSEGSAQWIGPWTNEAIPPTIHIALEGGGLEAPRYGETHHRHDQTTEFYIFGRGRTSVSFVEKEDLLPIAAEEKERLEGRTRGGLRRDISAALYLGDLLIVYPSDKIYHAEPVPRYSGPQRSLVIKWAGGLPVNPKDKIPHQAEEG